MDLPIIRARKLRVIYNQRKSNEVRALDGVDVEIFPHEFIMIHGPSGCGKSTLLYTIAALQTPTDGDLVVEEKDLRRIPATDKDEYHQVTIGMVFQSFFLIPSLSILENVCLPKVFVEEGRKARREQALNLLQRFGIIAQARKFPSQLSGGEKQRVAIARALINNPQIILADEPVGNLDSDSAANVLQILKELNTVDKKTVIMVTHNPEHLSLADRVIFMRDGRVVSEEINKEKRPVNTLRKKPEATPGDSEIPHELRMLARTFKNITAQQMNYLLVPYKAKQLMNYLTSELTEEQLSVAESYLKDMIFQNIKLDQMVSHLDEKYEKGGANWNRTRAQHFGERVKGILTLAEYIKSASPQTIYQLLNHMINVFCLRLSPEQIARVSGALERRVKCDIDQTELNRILDAPAMLGGAGLNKTTADKIARELEMIMLIKFSS